MRWLMCGFLCLLATAASAEAPRDFAYGIEIEASGPEALFAVELPQAVYEGVVRADLGDLRVFNAAGEAVPYAFLPRPSARREKGLSLKVPFFALRGDAIAGVEGVEVRIERETGKTVVTTNSRDTMPARQAVLLGYLVDARALDQPVRAVVLELPAAAEHVVTRLRVEASDDLARWTPLVSDAPVLRLEAGGQRLEHLRIEFAPRQARYFRLSWPVAARPLELAGLSAEAGDAPVEAPRSWKQVDGSALPGQKVGEYAFDLGGQFPVDRLRLRLPQANTVASVDILSRAHAGDPWRRVAVSAVYRLGAAGQEVVNPDIFLPPTTSRQWLLRVDQRGGGLGPGAPELGAGWLPQRLVFAARGAAPFQLVYGNALAGPVAYPIATLVPGYRGEDDGKPAAIPLGSASTGAARTLAGVAALRAPIDRQRWALWASLLLGVALLGWMALRLGRQLSGSKPAGPGDG